MAELDIIIAGFGGQGILSAGRILAQAGMFEDKNVSWLPSYGPEMRGGTANCHVVISDELIGSPILNQAEVLIAMNTPSVNKYQNAVVTGGLMVIDSSIVTIEIERKDIRVIKVPATQIASEMGNLAYANIIMLGRFISETGIVAKESFEKALKAVLPEKKHYLIPEEMKAFELGMEFN